MSTNDHFMNDDFRFFAVNMKTGEAVFRLVLAAALIAVLIADPSMEYKMLLVVAAVYLFTTAITRWEPLYAGMGPNPMYAYTPHRLKHDTGGKLRHGIHDSHKMSAANDGDEKQNEREEKQPA